MERSEKRMNDRSVSLPEVSRQLIHNSPLNFPWHLVAIFLILAVSIGTSGYLYYAKQKENIKKSRQDQLSAIADLKVQQIVDWRKERLADAGMIFEISCVSSPVHQLLKNPRATGVKQHILNWMTSLQKYYGYGSVVLLDSKGTVRLSVPESEGVLGPPAKTLVSEAILKRKIIFSDLHRNPTSNAVRLALIIPVLAAERRDAPPVGVFLLKIDPYQFLYPVIQSWPTPSPTSETLLIRREGNDALYLNELRHRKNTALSFRLPLTRQGFPEALAAHGIEGIVEGLDYRGVPVLAAVRGIPDTSWFLLAKTDTSEVYASVQERARLTLSLIAMLIISTGTVLALFWRRQSGRFYRRQYETERERRKSETRFQELFDEAPVGYHEIDMDGRVTQVNQTELRMLGYSLEEVMGKPIWNFVEEREESERLAKAQLTGKIPPAWNLERIFRRKDGTTFPVLIQNRILKDSEGRITGVRSTLQDISERKKAEEAIKMERDRLELVTQNIGAGLAVISKDYKVIWANGVVKQAFGDVEGKTCYVAYHGQNEICNGCRVREVFEKESDRSVQERIGKDAKGDPAWFEIIDTPIKDKDGNIVSAIELAVPITERKQAEEALRRSEERFRDLFDHAPVGYQEINMEGRLTRVNQTELEMLGYAAEEMIGRPVWEFNTEGEVARKRILAKLAGTVPPDRNLERAYVRKDGATFPVLCQDRLILDGEGKAQGLRCIIQDISERKRAEEALKETTQNFQSMIQASPLATITLDAGGNVLQWNRSAEQIFGWREEETLGRPHPIVPEEKREEFQEMLRKVFSGECFKGVEVLRQKKDGTTIHLNFSSAPLVDSTGGIRGSIGIFEDITRRKQAEEALRASEERFQRLFNEAPVGYHEFDSQGRITSVNKTESEMLGYTIDEMLGQPVWKFIVEEEISCKAVLDKLAGRRPPGQGTERTYRRKDGTTFPCLIEDRLLRGSGGSIIGIASTIQDITERKRVEGEMKALEEQLRQSQKMEAIGQLAGGVAHDFNNLLTIIKGYSELSLEEFTENDSLKGNTEAILDAANRASDLTRQLLAFSRRQVLELMPLDLNNLIQGIEKMLRRMIGEDIDLLIRSGKECWIKGDSGQMEQVIFNLAVNSRDAMPTGGKLILETENVHLGEEYTQDHIDVKPGHYVRLSVTDTGCGMPPEIKERVFEPFFTTKERDKGTGLGLSTVYGIVKQSNGNIWVQSEPGKGTTFEIYFPWTDQLNQEFGKRDERGEIPYAKGTVLVVEDEESVRKLAAGLLKKEGYKVLEAPHGGDASLICKRYKEPIDLILTDVVMPGMSGPELIDYIQQMRQDFKVLYMSGYTSDAIILRGVQEGEMDFIHKPFGLESLSRKVHEVLAKA